MLRFLVTIVSLLVAAASAEAQFLFFGKKKEADTGAVQERSMMERMFNPDLNQANYYNGKAFNGTGRFQSKEFKSHAFAGSKKAQTKTFEAHSFTTQQAAIAQKNFVDREKKAIEFPFAQSSKKYKTDTFETKNARESAAPYRNQDRHYPTRSSDAPAKAQGRLDAISDQITKQMTIEQVRELLNKNE